MSRLATELLRKFAAEGTAEAFSAVVQHHFAMVYTTAFRYMMGDRVLAMAVSRETFAILARNALSYVSHPFLADAVYVITCRVSVHKLMDLKVARMLSGKTEGLVRMAVGARSTDEHGSLLDARLREVADRPRALLVEIFLASTERLEVADGLGIPAERMERLVRAGLLAYRDVWRKHGSECSSEVLEQALSKAGSDPGPRPEWGQVDVAGIMASARACREHQAMHDEIVAQCIDRAREIFVFRLSPGVLGRLEGAVSPEPARICTIDLKGENRCWDEKTRYDIRAIRVDLGRVDEWGKPYDTTSSDRHTWSRYPSAILEWAAPQGLDCVVINGRFRVASFIRTVQRGGENTEIVLVDYADREEYAVVAQWGELQEVRGNVGFFKRRKKLPSADELEAGFRHFSMDWR